LGKRKVKKYDQPRGEKRKEGDIVQSRGVMGGHDHRNKIKGGLKRQINRGDAPGKTGSSTTKGRKLKWG